MWVVNNINLIIIILNSKVKYNNTGSVIYWWYRGPIKYSYGNYEVPSYLWFFGAANDWGSPWFGGALNETYGLVIVRLNINKK